MAGALFSTPFLMDPTNKKHLVIGANSVYESTDGSQTTSGSWKASYILGSENNVLNSVSAIAIQGVPVYVGFCSACDPVTDVTGADATKFKNGIATNVQDGCAAATGDAKCWHKAKAQGLPNRYISAAAIDPKDPKTVWVTLAGYARRWYFPNGLPGAGAGHLFVSHDAGEHFHDVSTNLPDAPANALVVRGDRIFVGTDVGVFASPITGGPFVKIGTGLPNAYVLDLRTTPNGNTLVAATHGRGVWTLDIAGLPAAPATTGILPVVKGVLGRRGNLPATGGAQPVAASLGLCALALGIAKIRKRVAAPSRSA